MKKKVSALLLTAFMGGILMMPSASYASGDAVKTLKEVVPISRPISLPAGESPKVVEAISLSAADTLNALGLFKGTTEGYQLDKTATRAEGLTMILRLIGEDTDAVLSESFGRFIDVPEGHWAYDNINYGAIKGYIAGTSATTFKPERKITEQEFIKILLSAMGHKDINLENAYEKALEFGVLSEGLIKSVKDEFLRERMVSICYGALLGKTSEGMPVWEGLVNKGLIDENKLKELIDLSVASTVKAIGFAWDLNKLMPQDQNYMFSPISIKMALAMAAVGADGETKNEILAVLGIDDLDAFMDFSKKIIKNYSENDKVALNIANSIWLNKDYYPGADFAEAFQQAVSGYFDAEGNEVDGANAVEKINNWVDEKTRGKINELINDSNFLAYIVNAIYFKGEWATQFEEAATKSAEFTDRNGEKNKIEFMNATDYYDYYANQNLQMIRLPYQDGKTSMYVALSELEGLDLVSYIGKMNRTKVKLSLPKFKSELSIKLNTVLKELGIKEAFIPSEANFEPMFTGIEEGENVYISDVIHKTFIGVDENGTEAAAVTGIGFRVTGMPMPVEPVIFNANRPFTYFIYDDAHQEILFMGEQAFAK